ncbi:unnamed protein product [Calypogeia fissa]
MADRHQQQSEAASLPVAQPEAPRPSAKASLSCVPYMDALWFCYSPVYQMKQYYRDGTFDSCGGKWGELFRCISLKTKSAADIEAILKEQEAAKQKQHIWRYRTEEEASDHWQQQFGHLQK